MNDQTLLFRQVHPNFIIAGEVSSQAFFPSQKDEGRLSVYDGDQISAKESHQHYTHKLRLEAIGVWATSGSEVTSIGLTYSPDPLDGNKAHAIIEFGIKKEKEYRKLAKKLKKFAIDRGSQYTPAGPLI